MRSRNYRLFFTGQIVSLIGTWMESLAMSWLVYRLTGSAVLLGTVAFSSQIPMFCVTPFAGVVTDRIDHRRLLIATQTVAMILAGILAVLTITGTIHVWHIIVLSVLVGINGAFDTPARQAFVPALVERREDLGNAIALNSTMFNIARLIGPAVAGVTISLVGEGGCFAINTLSFVFVIWALAKMDTPAHRAPAEKKNPLRDLREGAAYAWSLHPIRVLLGLIALASLASGAYSVLLPVYAADVYHGGKAHGPQILGLMFGSVGVGALVSATMLARRASVVGLGKWIVISSSCFGLGLILFGLARSEWLGIPLLALVGFGAMLHMGSTNTLLQTFVEDRMRGRVMAFYVMAFIGTMPIGSLVSGAASHAFGPTVVLLVAGLITLLGSYGFYRSLPEFRRVLRPIYEDKGILPSQASAQ
ncbi:MFS transporter [Fimbriimonas ginsengisoli]|uniref:MFS transporter n=1 Tax=Fimbriimonas ginsengisoli TaxID=1005039 RepID=UPI0022351507|nr:MFS transporter [Fimbriimonas ginsengisoli]